MSQASSTKPYLIRAVHEWCVDNYLTPYLVVKVDAHTRVPVQHVRDGQIVLNIGPTATGGLQITNDEIMCQARFGGVAQSLYVPISQVMAIFSRETGQGMQFAEGAYMGAAREMGDIVRIEDIPAGVGTPPAPTSDRPDPPPDAPSPQGGGKVSHLRRVK